MSGAKNTSPVRFRENHPGKETAFTIQFPTVFQFVEAADAKAPRGSVWEVTIIQKGRSSAPPHYWYPNHTLQAAAPLYDGAKVYAHKGGPHVDASAVDIKDQVATLSNSRYVEDAEGVGSIRALLNIFPSAGWLRENLLFAHDKKLPMPYELSHNAGGSAEARPTPDLGGEQLPWALSIDYVESVDLCSRGAAGGKFNRMVESHTLPHHSSSQNGVSPMRNKLLTLFLFAFPAMFMEAKVDYFGLNENELLTHLREADKASPRLKIPDGDKIEETLLDQRITEFREAAVQDAAKARALTDAASAVVARGTTPDQVKTIFKEAIADINKHADDLSKKVVKLQEAHCANYLKTALKDAELPAPLHDMVEEQFKGKIFLEADVDAFIKKTRDTYAKFVETRPGTHVSMGQTSIDKIKYGLEGFFWRYSNKPPTPDEVTKQLGGVTPMKSFREAYVLFTGDEEVSGEKNLSRMREAITTTDFANLVKDVLYKQMIRDYTLLALDTWRPIVKIVPLPNFMTQHRVRYGGYANLPTVGQGQAYAPMATPTDEEATYVPAKRGGTETITREMIKNDVIGAISDFPRRMARASAQTLHEFVYDLVRPSVNPTIYDSVALYHNNHANTGTTALSSGLPAARLRMKKQTMKDNSKRIGLRLRYILVPPDLEETAYGLVTPAYDKYNDTPTFLQKRGIVPIVIDYWDDATDWAACCDGMDCQGIELGFLDGNQEPQLFVSDLANVGSWFTNDTITYKIRHEYGAVITDYRCFDGSIVA